MKSINKVTLLGAVGQDPEIRQSKDGLCIASFSLATSEKRKDKEEVTQWHNCVAFGKLGEIVEKYIHKGSKLYVDGTIQYQCVEKEGEKRYYTKIVINDLSMLSSLDSKNSPPAQEKQKSGSPVVDDDIPF